jgi:hypothetical protein
MAAAAVDYKTTSAFVGLVIHTEDAAGADNIDLKPLSLQKETCYEKTKAKLGMNTPIQRPVVTFHG